MRTDFENIDETHESKDSLIVRWKGGSRPDIFIGPLRDTFMKQYRIWLSQQEEPCDRICDLDTVDKDGRWSREIETENMREMMDAEEKEKHTRMEDNFDGVYHLMNSVTTLQEKSAGYVEEIGNFQKETIKAIRDSESFLMNKNVTKLEFRRLATLINMTTECQEIGKKINAVALQILEDWII